MALDPEFVADCPYAPEGLLLDDILEIDTEHGRVVCSMPTHADLPITRTQRAHPVHHPRHVSGGLMVHMTGMVAFVHAYYMMNLHHKDGWIGYGGRIYDARFLKLVKPGLPLIMEATATKVRIGEQRGFSRYDFVFRQDGETVFRSDQSAIWLLTRSI